MALKVSEIKKRKARHIDFTRIAGEPIEGYEIVYMDASGEIVPYDPNQKQSAHIRMEIKVLKKGVPTIIPIQNLRSRKAPRKYRGISEKYQFALAKRKKPVALSQFKNKIEKSLKKKAVPFEIKIEQHLLRISYAREKETRQPTRFEKLEKKIEELALENERMKDVLAENKRLKAIMKKEKLRWI